MKRVRSTYFLVLVTAPNVRMARTLVFAALKARLAACGNLIPRIESRYWWRGRMETSAEVMILFKTTRARLKGLEKLITGQHPYDTPEFLVLGVDSGNRRYLDWIMASVSSVA